jgi:predicted anti-sigma-YlaC factor YlaD
MSACSFDRLLKLVNEQLDLDGQLEVYGHLDRCDICRDAVYQIARDRVSALFIYRAYRMKPSVFQRPRDAAVSLRVRTNDRQRFVRHSRVRSRLKSAVL